MRERNALWLINRKSFDKKNNNEGREDMKNFPSVEDSVVSRSDLMMEIPKRARIAISVSFCFLKCEYNSHELFFMGELCSFTFCLGPF